MSGNVYQTDRNLRALEREKKASISLSDAEKAAQAAVDRHTGQLDPHPQYVRGTEFAEAVDDRVAALINAGQGIAVDYDDVGNLLSISADLNFASNALAAPVSVPGGSWVSGPSIALPAGTWLIAASAHFIDTSAAANDVSLRISGRASAGGRAEGGGSLQLSTSAVIVLASAEVIEIEVNAAGAGNLAAALGVNPDGNTATRIEGVRLA